MVKRLNGEAASMPSKRVKILSDDEDEDEGHAAFKVNEQYAARFEHNSKRKELQKLEAKYGKSSVASNFRQAHGDASGTEESSSDEDEDDVGEFATEAVDAEIMDLLNAIRNRDPRLYDESVKFYNEIDAPNAASAKAAAEKGMSLKEYHRIGFLAALKGSKIEDEMPKSYVKEQEDIKGDLLQALQNAVDEGASSGDENNFLKAKEKPAAQTVKPALPDPTTADRDPEDYLSNFFAARAWVPKADSRFAHLESDNDSDVDRAEEFEQAYNLRFEDPEVSNQTLKSHARDAVNEVSVRREEKSSRAKVRERERERKQREKEEREAEKAQLKKLKMEQMEGKIEMIRKAAGGRDVNIADWVDVLEEDWDDDRFDDEMQKRFGEEYYQRQEEGEDGEDSSASEQRSKKPKKGKKKKSKPRKPTWDDDIDIKDLVPDFNDEDPPLSLSEPEESAEGEEEGGKHKSQKQQKASQKAQSRRDRRILDTLATQSLSYFPTQAGKSGGPRFQYRETSPQAFGLSALDILAAEDAQLNQYVGLKKLATFREKAKKDRDAKRLGRKGRLREWRKEAFGKTEVTVGDWVVGGGEERDQPAEGRMGKMKAEMEGADGVVEGQRKKKRRRKGKGKAGQAEVE